jgi:hypothetical protein
MVRINDPRNPKCPACGTHAHKYGALSHCIEQLKIQRDAAHAELSRLRAKMEGCKDLVGVWREQARLDAVIENKHMREAHADQLAKALLGKRSGD